MDHQSVLSHPLFTLVSSYHKPFPVPDLNFIKPIHAGKAVAKNILNLEGDNTGDNISTENPYFSELTVMYYIWKNYNKEQLPYWGMCHYRRYFTTHLDFPGYKSIYYIEKPEKAFKKIFTPKLVNKIDHKLENGYVIVPSRYWFIKLKKWSVKKQYIKDHDEASWNATEKAIKEFYPEYMDSCNEVMNGLSCSWYNMMIASWQFWDEYLTWLFKILFDVRKTLESQSAPAALRIYGNISERLLNVYLHHKKKDGQKVYYMPVVNIS